MPALKYQSNNQKNIETLLEQEKPALIHRILLNQPLRAIVILLLVAAPIPLFVYMIGFSREILNGGRPNAVINGSCAHFDSFHVPCGPPSTNEEICAIMHCCYAPESGCYHFWPSQYRYGISQIIENKRLLYPYRKQTPFGANSIDNLNFIVSELSETRLKIEFNQFPTNNRGIAAINPPIYNYAIGLDYLTIDVFNRNNASMKYLTSSHGPLIASRSYFEWTIYLETTTLFELDEFLISEKPFKKLYLTNEKQVYSPFIIAYNNDSDSFHAIKFEANSPIEIEITESSLIIFRSLNSLHFSLELFVGPTLFDLYKQIEDRHAISIGLPYWSLGIHICQYYTYDNINETVHEFRNFLNSSIELQIPFDSHCIEQKLWLLKDNFNDNDIADVRDIIEELQVHNKKFLLTMLPQIEIEYNELAYYTAREENLLLKFTTNPYIGLINNRTVAYIDWMTENTSTLENWLTNYYFNELNSLANGFLLDNNICLIDETKNLTKSLPSHTYPYQFVDLENRLENLVPPNIRTSEIQSAEYSILQRYNQISLNYLDRIKSVYNEKFAIVTNYNLNSNVATVAQQFNSTWLGLHLAVQNVISESLSGVRINGGLVCGNTQNNSNSIDIDEELCIRWYQFASVLPIFRITTDRTPDRFSVTAMRNMIKSIQRRYNLLGYFNTIYNSETNNYLIRPMFYNNHKLLIYPDIYSQQFLLGDAILVAPVILPRVTERLIYFPEKYFELWGGVPMDIGWVKFPVVLSDLPIFIKAGSIVPLHDSTDSLSAEESRLMPLSLYVALNCTKNALETNASCAHGEYFLTSKTKLIFSADINMVTIRFNSTEEDKLQICEQSMNITRQINYLNIYGDPYMTADSPSMILKIDYDICTNDTFSYSY